MIKRHTYLYTYTLLAMCIASSFASVFAQTVNINGSVIESGTGNPLSMVSVSVAATGISTSTDENGQFTLEVPDNQTELIFNLPGYTKRNIFLNGKSSLEVYLVPLLYRSTDDVVVSPLNKMEYKTIPYAIGKLKAHDMEKTSSTSFDQELQGKVAGLSVVEHSGMPGQRTNMNIRGYSSLYANNEPIIFIDGMIHDYSNGGPSLMEGFMLNPLDVVDIDDIEDITVMKDGVSFLGSAASNGIININTEQESETSTRIKFSAYGGIAMTPDQKDVLSPSQFNNYFDQMLQSQGYTSGDINTMYPWLHGDASSEGYYTYNNNTNWQDEVLKPGTLQKYHFFLKGGDDIATYNISTGYLDHKGIYDNSGYNRFNLRINGRVNITKRFSIQPNVKLSLANSKTHNQGYSAFKNPLTSALLKPAIMAPMARDEGSGEQLPYLEDVGVFNVSNPTAVVNNAVGTNVNYNFLSSMKANFAFNKNWLLSTLIGIDYTNAHEDIFLPDDGMAQQDTLINNSPGYFVNESQSVQSHTTLTYKNSNSSGHSYEVIGGMRFLTNNYKYNYAIDVNTASDEISSLGQGGGDYTYLRELHGDERGLKWISYFANANYNIRDKYFFAASLSYDGTSAIAAHNRFNFYPSLAAGWQAIPSLKVRGSWSQTGNMFSTVYDNSNLYYLSRNFNNVGVIVREAIPNQDLEIEKKTTYNLGLDFTLFRQRLNLHVDAYQSDVDNLMMHQQLRSERGYTDYVDNGGHLQTNGLEVSVDTRVNLGPVIWTVGLTAASQMIEMKDMEFINPNVNQTVTEFEGGAMVTRNGEAPNSFYGFKTNGVYDTDEEASAVVDHTGTPKMAGDIRYVGDEDGVIDDADKMVIGNPNPDIFGGLITAFDFKNLQISAQFSYSIGNDAFNYVKYQTESMSDYYSQSIEVGNRWTGAGTSAEMPRMSYGDPTHNTAFSDRWIEDASFVRLKNLTVSYDMPKVFGFRGLTIYATATNLLTFTKYSGYDPEFTYSNNMFYRGVDYGQMPQSRKFIAGIKLDL